MQTETFTDVTEITKRIRSVLPQAVRVVLFGSRATGYARPDSDADILVVAPGEGSRAERGADVMMALRGFPYGFDVIVLTPQEWEKLRGWHSSVVAAAESEGKVLYAA
jgi:predicted nucleotidyltransferase